MIYDYIIIGAGITGLYCGYRLYEKGIKNFIIVDKNSYIGGRALQVNFHETDVQMGAGIVTWHNKNLLELIQELKLEYIKFKSGYRLLIDDMNEEQEKEAKKWYNDIIKEIGQYVNNNPDMEDVTCMEYILSKYGKSTLRRMLKYAEYIEYFPASLKKTFRDYPIEDLYLSSSEIGSIKGGWNALINKLKNNFSDNIILNTEIRSIKYDDRNLNFILSTNKMNYINGKKVVIATDISIKNVNFENIKLPEVLNKIESVPYYRLYTYHNKHNIKENLQSFSLFRKIIPINKHILMSAYADTYFADKIKESFLQEDNESKKIENINKSIKCITGNKYEFTEIKEKTNYIEKYWQNGVHYYLPNYNYEKTYYIDESKNLIICGEMLSKPQGNVEACIRSINDMIFDNII